MAVRRRWVAGFLLAAALAWTRLGFGAEGLDAKLSAVLGTPQFRAGHWGLLVVDTDSGKTLCERNADELFCPASVTKLFSGGAALVVLGPDHRFETPLRRDGPIEAGGVLRGDLVLEAKGDLNFGGRAGPKDTLLFIDDDHTYAGGNPRSAIVPSDPLAGINSLAKQVAAAGVTGVTGEVWVDNRLFEPAETTGSGPSRVSPVLVNDDLIDVIASPGSGPGEPADVRIVPSSAYAAADVQVLTTGVGEPTNLELRRVGPRRFTVRGSLPVAHSPLARIYEVDAPASFARTLLIEALKREGVKIRASALADNPEPRLPSRLVATLPVLATHRSAPFRESLRVILKVSHNLHASTLPLLLAANEGKTTLAEGLARQGAVLASLGVDLHSVSFGGGAGGSRSDLVSPRATVGLLRALAHRPEFSAFFEALPVLGRDGTLARAVGPESPVRDKVRAKTGTYWVENGLDGKAVLSSKALAGYLDTASGRRLAFAVFVNNVHLDVSGEEVAEATAESGRLLGRVCEVLYEHVDQPAGVR